MALKQKVPAIAWNIFLFIPIACVANDQLTVHNHTNGTIYAAVYYVGTNMWGKSVGPAQRITPMVAITATRYTYVDRPERQHGTNRELLFSFNKTDLPQNIDKANWSITDKVKVGALDGSTFHIAHKHDHLKGYDNASWKLKNLDTVLTSQLASLKEQYSHHPYANITAAVRIDSTLFPQEIDCKQKRLAQTQKILQKLLGIDIPAHATPCIAVSLSGGGMRAAMCSYALMDALNDLNLMDTITYITALSGSTWFLANWLMSGYTIKTYKDIFINALTKPQLIKPTTLAARLWPKYLFGQDTSIVDLYGVYLAGTFFNYLHSDEARQELNLSLLQDRVLDGAWPFPLFTAGETTEAFNWCTFTPYQFISDSLHYSIPIWAFGRRFNNGKSVDIAPETTLGFMMGLWGSALSGSFQEMLDAMAGSLDPRLVSALSATITAIGLQEVRLAAIKICNPLYHMQGMPFTKNKHLIFVDGGYGYNVPLLPLFHPQRKADIIFILDVSENVMDSSPDMHKAIQHLASLGINMPEIDYKKALSQPISIFNDPVDPTIPTIIYVAPVKNDLYDDQFNTEREITKTYASARFVYNKKDIDKLTGLIKFNVVDNKKLILAAIKEKVRMKRAAQLA